MSVKLILFCVFSIFTIVVNSKENPEFNIVDSFPNHVLPNGGKIWVLLVAGSEGYFNYRHQADICHAYQLIHQNGIPDEQIIVMMVDDVAYAADNPTPGVIINEPNGTNVYANVPKDYTGQDVNPNVFLSVLEGNSTGVKGMGTQRVIESGPNDHIFVNFVDHGSPGALMFPNNGLLADDFIKVLNKMAIQKQFSKMVLYIEACHAGSMFDDLLADNLNIFVTTASDPNESSYACYYDEERQTYLADVFSAMWMYDAEIQETAWADLNHQFEKVRTHTNTSHVEEYGDLDIGNSKLKDFIGFHTQKPTNCDKNLGKWISDNDVADNIDVPLVILEKRLAASKTENETQILKKTINDLQSAHSGIKNLFEKIVSLTEQDDFKAEFLKHDKQKLNAKNFPCYRQLFSRFSEKCLNVAQNDYVRKYLQIFVNMCASQNIKPSKVLESIDYVCKRHKLSLHKISTFYKNF